MKYVYSGRGFKFTRPISEGKVVVADGEGAKAYPNAVIPEYQTKNAAGADFFCAEDVTIPSIWISVMEYLIAKGESLFVKLFADECDAKEKATKKLRPTAVHTGIKAYMEEDEVLELYNRSSNPKKLGLILSNGVGVVDADYYESQETDGEIMFAFYNILPFNVTIKAGDRIGQGVFKKFLRPTDSSLRVKDVARLGGYGSTDK